MAVRSERSTRRSSGEIRAFCRGHSLREQPLSLCHPEQEGHCSSRLCSSPPCTDTVTQVTAQVTGTAAQSTSWEEWQSSLNSPLDCASVLTNVWKQTLSQEMRNAVWSGKKPNKNKENLCREKNTEREVNLNLQLLQLQDSGGAPGRKIFHIKMISCLLKCFRASLLKPLLVAQNTIIAVTTATRSGVKDPHYVSHTGAAAESISWGRETTRMSMEDMWIMLTSPKFYRDDQHLLWYLIHAQEGTISKIKNWL